MAEENLDELLDSVQLKNRIVDGPVFITRNARQVVWQPGETKVLPRKIAEWFLNKSRFRVRPGDSSEGIPAKIEYKLVIMGDNQDETDITRAEVANVKELLDVENMPELARIDPRTGERMRRVYIDPRSTGAMSQSDTQHQVEKRVVRAVSSDIVKDSAERIADAAQGVSEGEIEAAVEDLTGARKK